MSTPTDPAAGQAAAAHARASVPLWQDADPSTGTTVRSPHRDSPESPSRHPT
ncbi:hypothetical protein OG982_30115 [Streptomyces sp. NBC_01551]|uniref:hypothetical protein n=1 Tax=Streptomyces sp. NBC_01551 TaxID=2975876 RepID=UPI0022577165|nr:hypothetical protein [Streptomyces sp. NBC_01551]MCX4529900.1 hypothetical protein [Streptomyces sp. NBC_01551]